MEITVARVSDTLERGEYRAEAVLYDTEYRTQEALERATRIRQQARKWAATAALLLIERVEREEEEAETALQEALNTWDGAQDQQHQQIVFTRVRKLAERVGQCSQIETLIHHALAVNDFYTLRAIADVAVPILQKRVKEGSGLAEEQAEKVEDLHYRLMQILDEFEPPELRLARMRLERAAEKAQSIRTKLSELNANWRVKADGVGPLDAVLKAPAATMDENLTEKTQMVAEQSLVASPAA